MKMTKQSRREAKQIFRSAFVNGSLDENRVRQIVSLLIEKKPRGFLAIITHLQRLIKLEQDRKKALIESAAPLPGETKTKVQGQLTALYGTGLNFIFSENPALIGGLRIKVGSDVYDGSVQ